MSHSTFYCSNYYLLIEKTKGYYPEIIYEIYVADIHYCLFSFIASANQKVNSNLSILPENILSAILIRANKSDIKLISIHRDHNQIQILLWMLQQILPMQKKY